jgi:toxin-antitoxin system, antitoxin component, xre family
LGIYDNVKRLCAAHEKKVLELETELGFPRSSISKWNDNIPSVLKVKKVAEYFGVAIDDLISDKDEGNE